MLKARLAIGGALALLLALHFDFWLAADGRLVLGLPASLAYHLGYCVVCGLVMALAVRYAWPREPGEGGHG